MADIGEFPTVIGPDASFKGEMTFEKNGGPKPSGSVAALKRGDQPFAIGIRG